jgi:hypothetical protein
MRIISKIYPKASNGSVGCAHSAQSTGRRAWRPPTTPDLSQMAGGATPGNIWFKFKIGIYPICVLEDECGGGYLLRFFQDITHANRG